ncbi:MAG: exo-alpha-sialidase [Synergistaceae bacterium]
MKITHREYLPSTTQSVHASSVEIWNGHPVFAWFGGQREGAQDVSIYIYNLNGEGETIQLGGWDSIPRWNPILVNIGERLILFEKAGIFCDRWQTFVHDITNWNKNTTVRDIQENQYVLPAGLNGPVKSRPFIDGNHMYCGSSVETIYDWSSYIEEYIIEDNGHLMFDYRSEPLTEPKKVIYRDPYSGSMARSLGIIQPTLWRDGDDLCAFFRASRGLGSIYFSKKENYWNKNSEWSNPVPTNMPNPNSAVDVATYGDKLYLVWNPDSNYRFPLLVSELERDGEVFSIKQNLTASDDLNMDNFSMKSALSPELSYPYMISHEGQLHLTYTHGRNKIEYIAIDID